MKYHETSLLCMYRQVGEWWSPESYKWVSQGVEMFLFLFYFHPYNFFMLVANQWEKAIEFRV